MSVSEDQEIPDKAMHRRVARGPKAFAALLLSHGQDFLPSRFKKKC